MNTAEKKKEKRPINLEQCERLNQMYSGGVRGVYHKFQDLEQNGEVTIKRITIDADAPFIQMDNFRARRDGLAFSVVYSGGYVTCRIGKQLMMSDTCMERITNKNIIKDAHGHVLIGGLGIGMLLENMLDNPEVTSITVVEKSRDLIELVAPRFEHEKLTVIEGDVFEFQPPKKYDTIYMDIWPSMTQDNLDEMKILKEKYRRHRRGKGSIMACWMEQWLRKERNADRRKRSSIFGY